MRQTHFDDGERIPLVVMLCALIWAESPVLIDGHRMLILLIHVNLANAMPHFGKSCRKLTPDIEPPTANQVLQILLAFIVQTMQQEILTVKSECLCRYAQGNDFKV